MVNNAGGIEAFHSRARNGAIFQESGSMQRTAGLRLSICKFDSSFPLGGFKWDGVRNRESLGVSRTNLFSDLGRLRRKIAKEYSIHSRYSSDNTGQR